MKDAYKQWHEDFETIAELCDEDELFASLNALLHQSRNTFALNRKLMQKAIDVSWVEAIENGLVHLDNCLRTPRRTIEDVEEIVPIALSRKITVESVKHLAQHTDLIQSVDLKTGKITPSKILNVHKEESLMTYENKFINTLVNRLYIFVNTRYEKLAQVSKDEQAYTLSYDTAVDDGAGGKLKMEVKLETVSSLDSYDASGYTVWQRVEKLKKAIEGYMGSELCQKLGTTYIRPPVMRTNAIMKNVDLKACLTLWQYIESYDKAGYEIRVEDTAVQPEGSYVEDFYRVVLMQMLLFRSQMEGSDSASKLKELKTQKSKVLAPKFLRRFDKTISADYDVAVEAAAGYIGSDGEQKFVRSMPEDVSSMFDQIASCITIEQAYQAELAAERAAARAAEEEEERRLAEQKRIEEARQAELERIEREREEEARRLEEMLAKKRAEQEAEMRERERQEAERLALLEEQRKREEELRLAREEAEREEAERQRIADEKMLVRSELGEAEGVDADALTEAEETPEEVTVTEEEVEEARSVMEENELAIEDPREVAARMKLEQQKREKERAERERAERLKAERQYFESKPFHDIYREYSHNPIYAIPRLIRYLLAVLFGLIPENTDDPDMKTRLAAIKEKKRLAAEEKEQHERMEAFYKKYAPDFPYGQMRWFADQKFKRKRAKEQKNKPRPVYNPPVRTPEEELEIRQEMRRLYREYHVTVFERAHRKAEELRRSMEESRSIQAQPAAKPEQTAAEQPEREPGMLRRTLSRIGGIAAPVILGVSLILMIYVTACTVSHKPAVFFGRCIMQVMTGSMEPTLHVDDCIIVEKVDPSTLQVGDIIVFTSEDPQIYGWSVTHRIVEITEDGNFVTRGDANPVEDALQVRPDQVAGKYIGKSRLFSWTASFADTRKSLVFVVMLIVSATAVYELRTVMQLGKEVHEENEAERRERLMREAIEQEKQRLAEEGYTPEPEDDLPETEPEAEPVEAPEAASEAEPAEEPEPQPEPAEEPKKEDEQD